MERPISEILKDPTWDWSPEPPAHEDQIAGLRKLATFELPAEYIELLRCCDGDHGELDASPLLFHMDSKAESLEHNEMRRKEGEHAGFWFIGGNGGLETIGFDLRSGPPSPLVTIDYIAGDESARQIAADTAEFVEKIGIAADRPRP